VTSLAPQTARLNLRAGARAVHNMASKALLTPLLKHEWNRAGEQEESALLTEYSVAFRWLAERYPQSLLDVGPGPGSWPHVVARTGVAVTAIDNMHASWEGKLLNRQRFFNRHYYVIRDDITRPQLVQEFDCVTCLNILGLVEDHRAALRGMFSVLKPGGFLIVSCPYNEHQFVASASARQYSRAELDGWLSENGGTLVEQELYRCFTGELWAVGERVTPPVRASADELHHMTCMLIQKGPAQ
jgi:SAM-dependent methyltransferase